MAAEEIGLRAVLVRAIDEHAGGFFRRYGFQSATDERLTLMVPLQAVRRQLRISTTRHPNNTPPLRNWVSSQ